MSSRSGIIGYIHCKKCEKYRRRSDLDVGVVGPTTLRIWCTTCDQLVGDLQLAEPVPMVCDECGTPLGPNHRHSH